MKKVFFILGLCTLLMSCQDKKQTESKEGTTEQTVISSFDVSKASSTAKFTAYKTSQKVSVPGSFTKIELSETKEAKTMVAAITGTHFNIPVSSLETKNESRNLKIVTEFFGKMVDPSIITGSFGEINGNLAKVTIKINGIEKVYDLHYSELENSANLKGEISILDFNAASALKSLNTICGDLHKGEDGISKTWNTVDLDLDIKF